MFTGLIEDVGTVETLERTDDGSRLRDPRRLGNRDPPRFTRERAAARDRGTRVAGTGSLGDRARGQREAPRPSALRATPAPARGPGRGLHRSAALGRDPGSAPARTQSVTPP